MLTGAEVESIAELKSEVAKSGPAVSLSLVRRPLALVFESTAARMRLSRGGAWAGADAHCAATSELPFAVKAALTEQMPALGAQAAMETFKLLESAQSKRIGSSRRSQIRLLGMPSPKRDPPPTTTTPVCGPCPCCRAC